MYQLSGVLRALQEVACGSKPPLSGNTSLGRLKMDRDAVIGCWPGHCSVYTKRCD